MEENIIPQKVNNLAIPIAIVIAGALIAGALFFGQRSGNVAVVTPPQPDVEQGSQALENVAPITSEDHILGNPNASVVIVEYSDFECPFCKVFHDTMNQVMEEHGQGGEVAWVFRHFPLDQLHPVKARAEAVASECANEQGGNDAFWAYANRFFEVTPSNNQTNIETVLPQIARDIGLDAQAFATCMTSGKYDQHVQDDFENAIATGGNGTPWSVVVTKSGKKFPLSGAQPYSAVKQIIELALQEG